ncbi:MMPL family transporter [Gordonia rhizosphera]|uniref:Membrane transport protein MMPL domain-containing protein n=1 Tax=Gordonia rhizosphera NBRC 16068 TaxID=1108045 RepID=K6WQF9_9ACTN|nr:MMPL family transporter [Gordonia rhizosphera]GAB88774.1 hypothetical protein GORHZ_040_00070 [Gordonia rhizosphera NBRC 16068]
MLTRITNIVVTTPRVVIGCAAVLFVLAAAYGSSVMTALPAGGYDNPHSEAALAEHLLHDKFGASGMPLVFTITSTRELDSPAVTARAESVARDLESDSRTSNVLSYWTTPRELRAGLVTRDGRTGLIAAMIDGDDTSAPEAAREIADRWQGTRDGITVSAGGQALAQDQINRQSKIDLLIMEAIAIPTTFVVLIWVFGSLVAAALPVVAALFSIVGAAAVLRAIYEITPVSVFAMNLATALSLALAIDYTLFIVSRYREERGRHRSRSAALRTTMATAGCTVIFSALTLLLTISTMTLMPGYFMKSLGYAGLAAVVLSLVAGLVIAPALIAVLGDRLDTLDLRKPIYRLLHRDDPRTAPPEQTRWYRLAMFSMRRPLIVATLLTAFFLLLALPVVHLNLNYPDDRTLPTSASSRQVGDVLRADVAQPTQNSVIVVLPHGAAPTAVAHYGQDLSRVSGVTSVATPDGMYRSGTQISTAAFGAERRGDAAYLTVSTTSDPFSGAGRAQLDELKSVPASVDPVWGGLAQRNIDNVRGVTDRIPLVLVFVVLSTTILMFMMTGSVILPLKALILNGLSLAAALGVLTWIFQQGHLGGLGTTSSGALIIMVLPLMMTVGFGIAMDYEVFVLSRIREYWVTSDRSPAANTRSVALGLAHTGRIVTAAALLMAVVYLALTVAQVSSNRMLGAGLCLGVLLDAFLIRTLLVPAIMQLCGRWNWWAPAPLARWYESRGLREELEPATTQSDLPVAPDTLASGVSRK